MRNIYTIVWICMLFTLFGCQKQGDSNDVQLTLDTTNRFTQAELQAAVDVVTKNFEAFTDCELKTLHYEDALQEEYIEKHMQYSSVQGKDPANIILLTSSFHTGKQASQSLQPDSLYEGWVWVLQREDASSPWIEVTHGYL